MEIQRRCTPMNPLTHNSPRALLWALPWVVVGTASPCSEAGGGGGLEPAPEPVPAAKVRYSLSTAEGKPGEIVTLKLSIETNTLLKAIEVAINFDESLLRVVDTTRGDALPAVPFEDVAKADFDNTNDVPGDQSDEGWIYLQLVAAETIGELKWPVGVEIPLYDIQFKILADAKAGLTRVQFMEVGPAGVEDTPLKNAVDYKDEVLAPANVEVPEEDLDDGGVIILGLGEIGFFLRADVNLDFQRDISDPIRTLTYLFQGSTNLLCFDAADANDDGSLDVSDPIYTLHWLYASGTPPPEPERWGPDPTPDKLCCEETGGCS